LTKLLTEPLRNVAALVAQKIYVENATIVNQIVYGAGLPKEYERTYQFRDDAWSTRQPFNYSHGHIAEYEFFYDWKKLQVDRDAAQHGSPSYVKKYQDVRPYLADIIYGGLSGDIFGEGYWRKARDAWSQLLQSLGKKKMKTWFREAFSYYGLNG
jgi:hypothetical protein